MKPITASMLPAKGPPIVWTFLLGQSQRDCCGPKARLTTEQSQI